MFFFDTDIEKAFRHLIGQDIHAAPRGHRRRDSHYPVIHLGKFQKDLTEHILIPVSRTLARQPLAGFRNKPARSMPYRRICLRRRIALALFGYRMENPRAFKILETGQCCQDGIDVIPVDRTEISESERLEKRPAEIIYQ